jgi:hypothetical protein
LKLLVKQAITELGRVARQEKRDVDEIFVLPPQALHLQVARRCFD